MRRRVPSGLSIFAVQAQKLSIDGHWPQSHAEMADLLRRTFNDGVDACEKACAQQELVSIRFGTIAEHFARVCRDERRGR